MLYYFDIERHSNLWHILFFFLPNDEVSIRPKRKVLELVKNIVKEKKIN